MQVDIQHRPSYALGVIGLAPGEGLTAEPGAMVSMSSNVQIETTTKGGMMKGFKRMLGGESFLVNTYRSQDGPGEITVAPPLPGDIVHRGLAGEALIVQSGSYIASSEGIEVDSKWGGAKSLFAGESLILLKVSGTGDLLMSSFGAIHEVDVPDGQEYIVDSGHIVAFAEGVQLQVRKVGGWKSTILSGEGLVAALRGPGKVYLQTRSPGTFVSWLSDLLPKQSSS